MQTTSTTEYVSHVALKQIPSLSFNLSTNHENWLPTQRNPLWAELEWQPSRYHYVYVSYFNAAFPSLFDQLQANATATVAAQIMLRATNLLLRLFVWAWLCFKAGQA